MYRINKFKSVSATQLDVLMEDMKNDPRRAMLAPKLEHQMKHINEVGNEGKESRVARLRRSFSWSLVADYEQPQPPKQRERKRSLGKVEIPLKEVSSSAGGGVKPVKPPKPKEMSTIHEQDGDRPISREKTKKGTKKKQKEKSKQKEKGNKKQKEKEQAKGKRESAG